VTREKLCRILLFAVGVAAAYPVRSYPVTAGLDASWAFGLNYAHHSGLLFGRDAIFTYGPLAWLALPMNIGNNLWPALVFQTASWVAFAGVLAWFVFVRNVALWRVVVFAVCLLAGWRCFHHWDYVGPEMFLAFLAFLLMGAATHDRHWLFFFGTSCFLGWTLLFLKFSAGTTVLSGAILLCLAMGAFDRRKAICLAVAALLSTALFVGAASEIYFSSVPTFLRYMRTGFEFSAAYSSAMSAPGSSAPLAMALALFVSWLMLIRELLRTHDRTIPMAIAMLGPWFLLFKHSFVREPMHAGFLFAFAPLFWAVLVLSSEVEGKQLGRFFSAFAIFAAVMMLTVAPAADPTRAPLTVDRLPATILNAVGSGPIAVFPYENAYAAANALNYRPLPVLQSYAAYTPYLDKTNAESLENDATAPRFVLFDWASIDGRHPLLDVPATALALYRHYDQAAAEGEHLLLRRRATPRFGSPRLLRTCEWRRDRPLPIPASPHPLIARISLQRTAKGTLQDFFFRLPAVTLMGFRVPPQVIEDGVPLNFLPWNLDEAAALFRGEPVPVHGKELALAGPGAPDFRESVRVEILEIPEIILPPAN